MDPHFNPEGIAPSSPRLSREAGSNLGWATGVSFNSNGVAAIATGAPRAGLEIQVPFGHNLFEVG